MDLDNTWTGLDCTWNGPTTTTYYILLHLDWAYTGLGLDLDRTGPGLDLDDRIVFSYIAWQRYHNGCVELSSKMTYRSRGFEHPHTPRSYHTRRPANLDLSHDQVALFRGAEAIASIYPSGVLHEAQRNHTPQYEHTWRTGPASSPAMTATGSLHLWYFLNPR